MTSLSARNRAEVLPLSLPPRMLSREQAAAYAGLSTSTFDKLVRDGRMPRPKRPIDSRTLWDRHQLDRAIDRWQGEADEADDGWNPEV